MKKKILVIIGAVVAAVALFFGGVALAGNLARNNYNKEYSEYEKVKDGIFEQVSFSQDLLNACKHNLVDGENTCETFNLTAQKVMDVVDVKDVKKKSFSIFSVLTGEIKRETKLVAGETSRAEKTLSDLKKINDSVDSQLRDEGKKLYNEKIVQVLENARDLKKSVEDETFDANGDKAAFDAMKKMPARIGDLIEKTEKNKNIVYASDVNSVYAEFSTLFAEVNASVKAYQDSIKTPLSTSASNGGGKNYANSSGQRWRGSGGQKASTQPKPGASQKQQSEEDWYNSLSPKDKERWDVLTGKKCHWGDEDGNVWIADCEN